MNSCVVWADRFLALLFCASEARGIGGPKYPLRGENFLSGGGKNFGVFFLRERNVFGKLRKLKWFHGWTFFTPLRKGGNRVYHWAEF